MPLGNPYGEPGDTETQKATLALALDVAQKAFAPRTTVQADTPWNGPDDWRATYMHVGDDNRAELLAAGQKRMAKQSARKA